MFAIGKKGLIFVSRGDADSPDFLKTDLVIDSAWHTLDMSSIMPPNVVVVDFSVEVKRADTARTLTFRADDYTNEYNIVGIGVIIANVILTQQLSVFLKRSNQMGYKIDSGTWVIANIFIQGWWI